MKEIRKCEIHGETLHTYYDKSSWYGQWKCLKCQTEEAVIKRQLKKIKCVEYKGGKCEICGYDKNYSALEFHHLDPNEKDFTISKKNSSWENIKKELDKCILVCANCHREIHNPDSTQEILQTYVNKHKDNLDIKKQKSKKRVNTPSINEIECKYKELKNYAEVAKFFNISLSTLKRRIKENNTPS